MTKIGRGGAVQGVGPGSVLGGRYAVTLRISTAAHHERWRASDRTLEREVVLVCFASGSPVAAAALDAARRAAGVEESRLVRVLDVGTDDEICFIVEEPLTGATSITELVGSGGLPAQEVRRLVGESASALAKARQRGLHHLALTPDSVLRMPGGAVKVRGIATDAALSDTESASGEQASRLDAIGLVKLVYAGLTARWPAGSPGDSTDRRGAGSTTGAWSALDPAPTIVGGVAPASEIVTGVPNDLDLICRMTLNDDRGPLSPGDLALQIAPWQSAPTEHEHGTGVGSTQTDLSVAATRRLPAVPAVPVRRQGRKSTGPVEPTDPTRPVEDVAAADSADRADNTSTSDGSDGASSASSLESSDPTRAVEASDHADASAEDRPAPAGPASTISTGAGRGAGIAAAGAAAAGAAGALGDRVGSFARAAADKATARAAERRAAHTADDERAEDIHLDDALDEAPPSRLEPAVPLLGRDAPEAPSKAASRIALAVIGVLVIVALVIGINNVMKIGQSDAPLVGQTRTVTGTRPAPPPVASAAPTPTPTPTTTTTPAEPITITGGTGFDPQGNTENGRKVKLVYDGDPSTSWTSRWYGTPNYNGKKDGVGVELDLNRSAIIKEVVLVLPAKQDVVVYAATTAALDGAQKIGSVTDQEGTVKLTAPAGMKAATKLLVWVTKAAPAEAPNHYRAQISEVTVR